MTPDDDLIDAIEAVAITAAATVLAVGLGTGLVVRALRRRWAW